MQTSFVRSGLAMVFAATIALAACQPSAAPGPATGPAPTSNPTAASTPSPAAQTPVTSAGAGPTAGTGSWTVTLTGPRTGAGTYTGTGLVICAAPTIDGRRYWTATAVIFSGVGGSLTDFSLQQNPDGRATITATAGGMETGSWYFDSTGVSMTASISATGGPGTNGLVIGDGTYTDSEGRLHTVHISAECSETAY